MSQITSEQNTLLKLISNALKGSYEKIEVSNKVVNEAIMQSVLTYVWQGVKNAEYEAKYNILVSKNMQVSYGHVFISKLLLENNISFVIIKGVASALYYRESTTRTLGDVDFLVAPEDFDRAIELFKSKNFDITHENHQHHVIFKYGNVRYEMHRSIPGIPEGEIGAKCEKLFCDVFEKSVTKEYLDGIIKVPGDYHHYLILLLHSAHHLIAEGIGLRHLVDICAFRQRYPKDEFERLFKDDLISIGLWDFSQILFSLCQEYFGVPFDISCDNTLTKELMLDIFKGGNFGKKDTLREQSAFVDSTLKSLNRVVYSHWAFAKKMPIVLPFGWAYYGGKYFVKTITGKRPKLRPKEAYSENIKRKEIYKKLNLFKVKKEEKL